MSEGEIVVGGWGYNEDHPDAFHALEPLEDGDKRRAACGAMTTHFGDGEHGTADWRYRLDDLSRAHTWWSRPCISCIRAGGFDEHLAEYDPPSGLTNPTNGEPKALDALASRLEALRGGSE